MQIVDTPDHRFEGLVDYPFAPHFVEVDARGIRMHHVDEGPRDGRPVLLLHGEPSWSYLYRFMIPPLVKAGHRVIAPDLVGFGKSSKLTRVDDYSYALHCDWVRALIETLELEDITLFAQDWGSLIGLRLAAEMEQRFSAIVISNGFLPDGRPMAAGVKGMANIAAFFAWRTFAHYTPRFRASAVVSIGAGRKLSREERRAYDAPFTDEASLAGARAFPRLVPISPRDPAVAANRAAWKVLERWNKPFVTAFSDGDPITRGLDRPLQRRIPGAALLGHHTVRGGHFVQEVSGPRLAEIIVDTVRAA